MQYSTLIVAGLCAVAIANPDAVEKRAVPASVSSSILAQISSIEAGILPPPSIASELTGVPPAVTSAIFDPTAFSSIQASIIANGLPAWFTALPADAQSYLLGIPAVLSTAYPKIQSLQAQLTGTGSGSATATGSSATTTVTSTSKSTSYIYTNSSSSSVSTRASTSVSTTKVTTTSAAATTAKPSSASSSSAGAAPTGVIAAGVLGAVGFLGFALAL